MSRARWMAGLSVCATALALTACSSGSDSGDSASESIAGDDKILIYSGRSEELLAPLFEQGGVSIVFAGHVHNYQRSHPLTFVPSADPDTRGRVAGDWTLDRAYDGRERTRPEGILYLVTGAGGARLYNPEQQDDPASWQPFTKVFVSKVHSFTTVDVEGPRLTVRQVSAEGAELDRFLVTK